MPNKAKGVVDKLWNLFSSMKTGLFLLWVSHRGCDED